MDTCSGGVSADGPQVGLPPAQFAAAFPFHVAVDARLSVVQAGATLRRICADVRPGAALEQLFRPLQPAGPITPAWIGQNRTRFFLLEHHASGLQLRGEFVELPGTGTLVFLCSPWFTDAVDIARFGLDFGDFAVHDPVVDMLLLFQANKVALADAKRLGARLTAQRAELRAANERLRGQEATARRLALIAARTDNAVALTDATGAVLWINEGFTRMTGYALDEMAGRKPGAVLQGPGTDTGTSRRMGEQLRQSEGFREEILNYRKDGSEYWAAIEVRPIHDEAGRLTNYMSIESDITARRTAEEALRQSEERFRLSLEGADLGSWDVHVPTDSYAVNDRYLGMIGYAPGEFPLRLDDWPHHLHPDDVERATTAFTAHLKGRTPSFESEYRMRHKSGNWVWVLGRGRVTERDAGGRALRVCGTHLDVTGRKAAESELQEERRLLELARLREVETGHEIQRALLLGNPPVAMHGIDIGSYTAPSQGIDGDFYSFTTYRGDCLELLVGDVMGKGVPAALVGAAVRTTYNEVVTELLATSLGSGLLPRPAAIMNAMHARLTPRLIELDTFVTMALYRFDLAAGTLAYVNAGHTSGLLAGAGDGVTEVQGSNLPMGVLRGERYVEDTVPIRPGEELLVFSDGLTEARDSRGTEFGEAGLRDFIARTRDAGLPAGIRLQALRQAVRDFVGSEELRDDESAVLIGVDAAGAGCGPDPQSATETFDLPWTATRLHTLRERVAAAGAPLGSTAADGLVLAAFEAATNVVRHVKPPFPGSSLACRIVRAPAQVTVEIWYPGPPFEPAGPAEPDFSGASDGGFGLFIMANAVSSVAHLAPWPGVCCTRLVQRAAPAPGDPAAAAQPVSEPPHAD